MIQPGRQYPNTYLLRAREAPNFVSRSTKQTSNNMLPKRFGKYELLDHIGTGGMAEVYKARLPGLAGFEKTVVIKKLRSKYAHDAEYHSLFIEEAKLAAQVQHKNVVQVFDLGECDSGELYMAMEYVHGTDLRNLIDIVTASAKKIPVWFAIHVTIETLEALTYAHSLTDTSGKPRNLVHCDVTPENIFLSYLGEIKLADFGVAKDDSRGAVPSEQVKGKLPYMSPEQILGQKIDAKSDVFSAAVVLWELLSGRRLFPGRTSSEILAQICACPRPHPKQFRDDVPDALNDVLQSALAAEANDRMASARHFSLALTQVLHSIHPHINLEDIRTEISSLLLVERKDSKTENKLIAEAANDIPKEIPLPRNGKTIAEAPTIAQPELIRESPTLMMIEEPTSHQYLVPNSPRSLSSPNVVNGSEDLAAESKADNETHRLFLEYLTESDSSLGFDIDLEQTHFSTIEPEMTQEEVAQVPSRAATATAAGNRLRAPVEKTKTNLTLAPASQSTAAPKAKYNSGPLTPARPPTPIRRSDSKPKVNRSLWLSKPDGSTSGPLDPESLLNVMESVERLGLQSKLKISADRQKWITQDILDSSLRDVIACRPPRKISSFANWGELKNQSLTCLLGHFGSEYKSGKIIISKIENGRREQIEFDVHAGMLTNICWNGEVYELWRYILRDSFLLSLGIDEIFSPTFDARKVRSNLTSQALKHINQIKRDRAQAKLEEALRWNNGYYAFEQQATKRVTGLGQSLLRLLPMALYNALSSEELIQRIGHQRLATTHLLPANYTHIANKLGLSASDSTELKCLSGVSLEKALKTLAVSKEDIRYNLMIAYILCELDILEPTTFQ